MMINCFVIILMSLRDGFRNIDNSASFLAGAVQSVTDNYSQTGPGDRGRYSGLHEVVDAETYDCFCRT